MAKVLNNSKLKNLINIEINAINKAVAENNVVQDLVIYSFLKSFATLEQFIIDAYEKYAIGYKSSYNYKPKRLVKFKNIDSVEKMHSKIDGFITLKVINYLYLDLFESGTTKNPFENLFQTTFWSEYIQMEKIRNYICHRSEKALKEFYNKCTFGAIISVEDYLINNGCAKCLFYLDRIKDMSESIVNPL